MAKDAQKAAVRFSTLNIEKGFNNCFSLNIKLAPLQCSITPELLTFMRLLVQIARSHFT